MNGGMAPVPQFARIFMDVYELCSRWETENQIVVCHMTHAYIRALIGFMELFADESPLCREDENLASQGELPNCYFFVKLNF